MGNLRKWKRLTRVDVVTSLLGAAANVGSWVWTNRAFLDQPIPWYAGVIVFCVSMMVLVVMAFVRARVNGSRTDKEIKVLPDPPELLIDYCEGISVLWVRSFRAYPDHATLRQRFTLTIAIRNNYTKSAGIRFVEWSPHSTFKRRLRGPENYTVSDATVTVPSGKEFHCTLECEGEWDDGDITYFIDKHEVATLKFRVDNRHDLSVKI